MLERSVFVWSVFLFLPLLLACTSETTRTLTSVEKDKLGSRLQRILDGNASETQEVRVDVNEEGASIFPVFIRVNDPEVFQKSDIPVNSWSGNVATARLTADQIRRAAQLESVQSIRLSGRAQPTSRAQR